MVKLCANLSMLYNEINFLDRFEAAAKAGFRGVEFQFPYDVDKQQIADRLAANGLTQVLHNLPAGDWSAGERGLAVLPDRVGEFQESVGTAIDYAMAFGCRQLNCLAGIAPPAADADKLRETLVNNLRFAADQLAGAGISLLVEAINTRDMPGFYLNGTQQTLALIDAVERDNIFLQYDIYHMQVMEGDLAMTMQKHLPRIGHIQLADNPGRHEPGSGEIHYPFLLDMLDNSGYTGWIGCEYRPQAGTDQGLAWASRYLSN
ncbi:MAG: hydroxypyruvate isomerase [Gammaproteobacteria bacterium]|nr:hydroxypyruvate isomerase [Gammaproteobacteria bacterium]